MKTTPIRRVIADNIRLLMSDVTRVDTRAKLAARAGIRQSSLQKILDEDIDVDVDTLQALADAFGICASDLLMELEFVADRFTRPRRQLPVSPGPHHGKNNLYIGTVTSAGHEKDLC